MNAGTTRYWEYISPPTTLTVLPINACAASEPPAATTTPAPSLPTASDCPSRAFCIAMAPRPTGAVTTGRVGASAEFRARHIGHAEEQTEIGWIDRGCFHAHQNVIRIGFRHGCHLE